MQVGDKSPGKQAALAESLLLLSNAINPERTAPERTTKRDTARRLLTGCKATA
jgi:hypothetical protein